QNVEKGEHIRHILDRHIVCNDVALEPSLQLLAHFFIGVDPNVVRCGEQKEMRIKMTLGVEDARFLCRLCTGSANVVRGLSVQKTNSIGTAHAQLRAGRKIEE